MSCFLLITEIHSGTRLPDGSTKGHSGVEFILGLIGDIEARKYSSYVIHSLSTHQT